MTPKYPATMSSQPPSDCDTPVAPYLTHVITHHGQLTLVPPQNQGRVRTNKKVRKTRAAVAQTEQTNTEGQSGPSLSTPPLESTTPGSEERKKPRRGVLYNAPSIVGYGPSRATTLEMHAPIVPLPPPPSYESLRPELEVGISPSNDVISLASSSQSSDDFEDIAQVDFESQWELDRMAGFSLEERVRREWHRRQAVVDRTERTTNVEPGRSNPPTPPPKTPSRSGKILLDSSTPPPIPHFKDLSGNSGTRHSSTISSSSSQLLPFPVPEAFRGRLGPSPPLTSTKSTWKRPSEIEANSSKSSLEDWDIVEPVPSNAIQVSRLQPNFSISTSGYTRPSGLPDAPDESLELAVANTPLLTPQSIEPRSPASDRKGDATFNSPSTAVPIVESKETIEPIRTSRKGKEREIYNICDPEDISCKLSVIHGRPLPVPPGRLEALHPTTRRTATSLSLPSQASSSSVLPLGYHVPKFTEPRTPADPSDPAPESTLTSTATVTPASVRDHITRFESMRNRPVPPPPPDFLLRARAKRKPPPPPPSSCRLSGSDTPSGSACISQRSDATAKGRPSDGIEAQSVSSATTPLKDYCLELTPQSREVHKAPPSSSALESAGPASVNHRPGTKSSILVTNGSHSTEAYDSVSARDPKPNTMTELSINSGDLEYLSAGLEPVAVEASTGTSRQPALPELAAEPPGTAPPDSSIAGSDASDVIPSTSAVSVAGGAQESLGPYTDLDVLLSRLDDASSGNRYEDLLIVSELLGPAQPQSTPSQIVEDLPLGRVEVVRRRKLQDGRIKLKLSLFGVMVDRCGVCLSQFKDAEWAVLLPCVHSFHSTCLQSWMARSRTCPLCRVALNIP